MPDGEVKGRVLVVPRGTGGAWHFPYCLVARYAHAAEQGGDPDGFPWCTCLQGAVTARGDAR